MINMIKIVKLKWEKLLVEFAFVIKNLMIILNKKMKMMIFLFLLVIVKDHNNMFIFHAYKDGLIIK